MDISRTYNDDELKDATQSFGYGRTRGSEALPATSVAADQADGIDAEDEDTKDEELDETETDPSVEDTIGKNSDEVDDEEEEEEVDPDSDKDKA